MSEPYVALRQALESMNAMLTHMGMDEDEWNRPTFKQMRDAITAARAALDAEPPDCVKVGDGTLHGAIDYWQHRCAELEARPKPVAWIEGSFMRWLAEQPNCRMGQAWVYSWAKEGCVPVVAPSGITE